VVKVATDAMKASAKRRERVIKPPEFESMKTSHNTRAHGKAPLH